MDDDLTLFLAPLEALNLSAHWVYPDGWRLVITARRVDQSWQGAYRSAYDHLSTAEVMDVLEAEVQILQGMADGAQSPPSA